MQAAQAVVQRPRSRRGRGASRRPGAKGTAKPTCESPLRSTASSPSACSSRRPGRPRRRLPLLVIQQVSRLRVMVPVPEQYAGGMVRGARVPFRVPAFPDRIFTGTMARIAMSLDPKTRTMAVELEVVNRDGSLAPGMYPTVKWPVRSGHAALWVPETAVVTTTREDFRHPQHDGKAEWVDMKKGAADGDLVEVMGNLKAGDRVVKRGSDEIREGANYRRRFGGRRGDRTPDLCIANAALSQLS